MTINFEDTAEKMGLDMTYAEKGLYSYKDQYSEVVYRQLATEFDMGDHPTDAQRVPIIAIFSRGPEEKDFRYVGPVSNKYKFIGNDVLNNNIRESIHSIGMPIVKENTLMNDTYTRMRNEIIIQNGKTVPKVGDVFPVMIVNNSYDGKLAAKISWGISMPHDNKNVIFSFSLGEMRQIHSANAKTTLTSAVNSYMTAFSENITDMISQSFENELSEDEMLGVLDVVEKIGKKKRDGVSVIVDNLQQEAGNNKPTAWQLFLAILTYSAHEENLNTRKLLENVAESVLVVPQKMMDVLERVKKG